MSLNEDDNDRSINDRNLITVGRMVNVKARTWPGINKPGGIARVTKVYGTEESVVICVDVLYALGGREKSVPISYVALAPQYEQSHDDNKLRDRSILLGRCKRCGSLRTDCNSCDWVEEAQLLRGEVFSVISERRVSRRKLGPRRSQLVKHKENDEASSSSSSSSDEGIQCAIQQQRNNSKCDQRIHQALHHSLESSESDVLANIINQNRRQRTQRAERKQDASPEPRRPNFGRSLTSTGGNNPDFTMYSSSDVTNKGAESSDVTPCASSGDEFEVGTQDLSPLRQLSHASHIYSPSKSSPHSARNMSNSELHKDLAGFIQPEGNAEYLPEDIVDMTHGLSLQELRNFFHDQIELLRDGIAEGRIEVASLRRKMQDADTDADKDFEQVSATLYNTLLNQLIRNGRDQCRIAIKKMSRLYRKEKVNLTKDQRIDFRTDAIDLELDRVSDEADDLVRTARQLYHRCLASRQQADSDDMSFSCNQESSSCSASDCVANMDIEDELEETNGFFVDGFDPHIHARRIRKSQSGYHDGMPRRTKSRREHRRQRRVEQRGVGMETSTVNSIIVPSFKRRASSRHEFLAERALTGKRQRHGRKLTEMRSDFRSLATERSSLASIVSYSALAVHIPMAPQEDPLGISINSENLRPRPETSRLQRESRIKDNAVLSRMEAFLKANTFNSNVSDNTGRHLGNLCSDSEPLTEKRDEHRSQSPRGCAGEVSIKSDGRDRRVNERQTCDLSAHMETKLIYQGLKDQTSALSKPNQPITRHEDTRSLQSRANQDFLIEQLTELCDIADLNTIARSQAVRAFHLTLDIYQAMGMCTLQEIIASSPSRLPIHENLLVSTIRLLGNAHHKMLTVEDGKVFRIFADGNPPLFIEAITLQLLDSYYAVLHSDAWVRTNVGDCKSSISNSLTSIRNELLKILPGVSYPATLLLHKFTCQQWRKSIDKKAFVSSINPQSFRNLLHFGVADDDSTMSRLYSFGECVPRIEIEVIWTILGLFARTSAHGSETHAHWVLMKLLLMSSAGVLAEQSTEPNIAEIVSSEQHLWTCETELLYFSTLLSSDALNPLPQADEFFKELIRRTLMSFQSVADGPLLSTVVNVDESYSIWSHSDPVDWNDRVGSEPTMSKNLSLCIQTPLERQCYGLIKEYSERLPSKRARLSRFSKAMQQLGSEFRAKACILDTTPVSHVPGDTFASAFSIKEISEKKLSTRSMFLNECAAKIKVCTINAMLKHHEVTCITLVESFPFNETLAVELWQSIANPEMSHTRLNVCSREDMATYTYNGSLLRLRSASRIMASLFIVDLGDSHCSVDITPLIAFEADVKCLEFAVSSLFACMNCACAKLINQGDNIAQSSVELDALILICDLATLVTALVCQVRSQIISSKMHALSETTQRLAQMCFNSTRFCLESLVNTFNGHHLANTAVRVCLTLVRHGVILSALSVNFVAAVNDTHTPTEQVYCNAQTSEDFFGDLDDAAFLGLCVDTDCVNQSASSPQPKRNMSTSMFTFLANLLVKAKPSDRFLPALISNLAPATSSAGNMLISRQAGAVCACLAALSALLPADNSAICEFLCLINAVHDVNDSLYLKCIEQCFYSEVCRLACAHRECENLVNQRLQDTLGAFMVAALDSAAIERFPSSNLESFYVLSGHRGYEREKRRLRQANLLGGLIHVISKKAEESDMPGPVYNAINLWTFSTNLGRILCRAESSPLNEIGQLLLNASTMNDNISVTEVICLEREVLQRIKLACTILISTSKERSSSLRDRVNLWKFNVLIASSCSMNLVAIADGLDYQNRATNGLASVPEDNLHTHKGAKLTTLQSCYSHLTASILCVLCCQTGTKSAIAQRFVNDIRDCFLSPILSQSTFDVRKGLYRVAGKQHNDCCPPLKAFERLGNDLLSSCLQRSKEFVSSVCLSSNPSSVIALIAVFGNSRLGFCVETAAALIADAFLSGKRILSVSTNVKRDRMSLDVDNLFDTLNQPMRAETGTSSRLLQFTIERVIVPKLQNDRILQKVKVGALQILENLFRFAKRDMMTIFTPHLLCCVAKGIWAILVSSISSGMDDEEILIVSLKCSSCLFNLRQIHKTDVHHGTTSSILFWCSGISNKCQGNKSQVEGSTDACMIRARFLSIFADALKAFSTLVAYKGQDINIGELVKALRGKVTSSQQEGEICKLAESSLELDCISKLLFVEKGNLNHIVNVYAKPKASVEPGLSLGIWTPSAGVRRAAKEFIAVFTAQYVK